MVPSDNEALTEPIVDPDLFSAANLALAGFSLTNALGETCLLATKTCLTYAFVTQQLFGIPSWNLETYICGMDYKYFSPHCCKCNSFGCTAAIRWGNACHGPHSDSLYSGSEHSQFNSPRLVKREAGFPNPRRALIGSNQLWRVNDSLFYGEYRHVASLGHNVLGGNNWTYTCDIFSV